MDQSEECCNVRVVVRVRPLVARERIAGAVESIHLVEGSNSQQVVAGSDHSYSFDQVSRSYQLVIYVYIYMGMFMVGVWRGDGAEEGV